MNDSSARPSNSLFKEDFRNPAGNRDWDPDFGNTPLTDAATRNSHFIEGTVIRTHPASHTVDVDTNIGPMSGLRIMSSYISPSGSGDTRLPEPGANCIICTGLEIPVIMGFITEPDSHITDQDNAMIPQITPGTNGYGGSDTTYTETGGSSNHRGGRSNQLMPGDQIIDAPEGNLIAVLRGLTVMKGGELSQLIMTNLGGLVRMVSNLYQHFNAAGVIEIKSVNGKASITIKAGSDVKENGEVEPTVHLSIGADGDLMELRITDEDGEQHARVHVDPTGNVEVELQSQSVVIEGDVNQRVKGSVTQLIDGALEVSTSGATRLSCIEDLEIETSNTDLKTRGKLSIQSGGDRNDAVSGKYSASYAKESVVQSLADYKHELTTGDFRVATKAGAVELSKLNVGKTGDCELTGKLAATLGGDLRTTIKGKSVLLGDGAGLAVIRNTDLLQLVDVIILLINTFAKVGGAPVILAIPPGGLNPAGPVIAALGSKIVKA